MQKLMKKICNTVSAVIIALFAASAIPQAAQAADSHLGQPVGNMVTIRAQAEGGTKHGTYENDWVQVLPDGTLKKFELPKGYLLVVTDVDWLYITHVSPVDILQSEYHLSVGVGQFGQIIYSSNPHSFIRKYGSGDQMYVVGGHDSLTTGFVVGGDTGFSLHAGTDPQIQAVAEPENNGKTSHVILHGYLISAWQ